MIGSEGGAAMVHGHCIQLQSACRGDAAAGAVQLGGLYGQYALPCMDDAARGIDQLPGIDTQVAGIAGEGAAAVVETAGDGDPAVGRTCRT